MQLKAHTKQFRRTFTHMQFVFVIGVSTAMRARTTLKYGELCDNNIQLRGRRPHFKLVWMQWNLNRALRYANLSMEKLNQSHAIIEN